MSQVITAIKPTRRAPGRLSIYVGKRFVGTLAERRVDQLGLAVGRAWDEPLRRAVEAAVKTDKALRQAVRLLSRRAYSRGEIRDRLVRAGRDAEAIDGAMAALDRMHLLDDASYGRAVIERLTADKPAGRRLLRHKLMQKKLDGDLIEQLLDDEADRGGDIVADVRRLAEQRLASAAMQRCDAPTRRRRLWGYLARRGFDAQTIGAAMDGLPVDADGDIL